MRAFSISLMLLALATGARSEIDFSSCGYRASGGGIPLSPIKAVVTAADRQDDRAHIQAALDYVAGLPADADGLRGAVLLQGSAFTVREPLLMRASGVVLRGCGSRKTVIRGLSVMREPMIRVVGEANLERRGEFRVVDETVPAGAMRLTLDKVDGLTTGQGILITRPSTKEWIASLGMDRPGIAWKPGSRDIRWERRIVNMTGNRITLDAPITTALASRFGGARVQTFAWPGRISEVGVENLMLVADEGVGAITVEDRPWFGVTMENVANAWVRQVRFSGFAGSAVALWESTKNVTVQDCLSENPRSEIGGYRRHTYFTMGQQALFLRCWSENGRHDFAVGHCAAGPNAFVACEAHAALDFSGPIESWASGVLYDNVTIDGAALQLGNRWSRNQGAGWSAANCTIWQAQAAEIRCFAPGGATNRAVGTWGRPVGDGRFERSDEFAKPRSLFRDQLARRLGGEERVRHIDPIERQYPGATNPTPEEVREFVRRSNSAGPSLRDTIEAASKRALLWDEARDDLSSVRRDPVPRAHEPPKASKRLRVREGTLVVGNRVLQGKRFTPGWWRGTVRPGEAPTYGPAITRFVPGRIGRGFTDDLGEVADELAGAGYAVFEHHHGLWYDRRRDDHLRVRRANGNVVPPFYEQPFARSGQGIAWDGLSRYDLARFHPWYWRRLGEFAEHCDEQGLVLLHQHYFQHNLLEAGAHWADFPWRSANNINATGFPEPPPYAGDKRIFQAHLFYDTSHARRRDLHRSYIRQCLENTARNTNVIHSVGAEFNGPLAFMEFWVDTIVEWEREAGRDVLVSLSCTKDVQDAILGDPDRAQAISIIDIRYWWDPGAGKLYAPPGGGNLSPRQQARRLKPKRASAESKRRVVEQYRKRYPRMVVLFDGEPQE